MQALIFGVAEHQAVVGVPKHEGLGDRLDRLAKPVFGGRRNLRLVHALRHVDRDADQTAALGRLVLEDVGAFGHPDPLAVAATQPAAELHRPKRRRHRLLGDFFQRAIAGVHETAESGERQHGGGAAAGRPDQTSRPTTGRGRSPGPNSTDRSGRGAAPDRDWRDAAPPAWPSRGRARRRARRQPRNPRGSAPSPTSTASTRAHRRASGPAGRVRAPSAPLGRPSARLRKAA